MKNRASSFPARILVIRFSSLGDLVLTTPVFREIKKIAPECHVTLLTSRGFGEILCNNPYIDDYLFHPRKESWSELQQLIQRQNPVQSWR
ncbi:MAG: hypothetical protein HQM12_24305 [SAR324 cluster bacterium]|nr:hypothetical protein [SAR324 cluster bacterium]